MCKVPFTPLRMMATTKIRNKPQNDPFCDLCFSGKQFSASIKCSTSSVAYPRSMLHHLFPQTLQIMYTTGRIIFFKNNVHHLYLKSTNNFCCTVTNVKKSTMPPSVNSYFVAMCNREYAITSKLVNTYNLKTFRYAANGV